MNDGQKIIGASALIATGSIAVLLLTQFSIGYIPNVALQKAADQASGVVLSQQGMFRLLSQCSWTHHLTPGDLGGRLSTIHSIENDAGLFATTTIDCRGRRCGVTATALIPIHATPDVCRNPGRRGGRRRGFADYFDTTNNL